MRGRPPGRTRALYAARRTATVLSQVQVLSDGRVLVVARDQANFARLLGSGMFQTETAPAPAVEQDAQAELFPLLQTSATAEAEPSVPQFSDASELPRRPGRPPAPRQESAEVEVFVREFIELGLGKWIPARAAREVYLSFSAERDLAPLSPALFRRGLQAEGLRYQRHRPPGGRQLRVFFGGSLRPRKTDVPAPYLVTPTAEARHG